MSIFDAVCPRHWLDTKDRHHQPCRMNSLNRFADPVYCIVRLIVGLTYACHGGQKLLGYPGGGHGVDGIALIAGIIELLGGFLIAFGLFTRIAAFLASGEMAVAYFMFYVGVVPTLEAKFEANSPCCIAGFSFSLSFTVRGVGASMRYGAKTEAARRPPDPNLGSVLI